MIETNIKNINKIGKKVVAMVDIPDIGLYLSTIKIDQSNYKYEKCIDNISGIGVSVEHYGEFGGVDSISIDLIATENVLSATRDNSIVEKTAFVYMAFPDDFNNVSERMKVFTGIIDQPNFDGGYITLTINHDSEIENNKVCKEIGNKQGILETARLMVGGLTAPATYLSVGTLSVPIKPENEFVFPYSYIAENKPPFTEHNGEKLISAKILYRDESINTDTFFVSKNNTRIDSIWMIYGDSVCKINNSFTTDFNDNKKVVKIAYNDKNKIKIDIPAFPLGFYEPAGYLPKNAEQLIKYNAFDYGYAYFDQEMSTSQTIAFYSFCENYGGYIVFNIENNFSTSDIEINIADPISGSIGITNLCNGTDFFILLKRKSSEIIITITNKSGGTLDLSSDPIKINKLYLVNRTTIKDALPEEIYVNATDQKYKISDIVQDLFEIEFNYSNNIDGRQIKSLPPASTYFDSEKDATAVLEEACYQHAMYGFYDYNNDIRLVAMKKYEDLEFTLDNNGNIGVFVDKPEASGSYYPEYGVVSCNMYQGTVSDVINDMRFRYSYNPINSDYSKEIKTEYDESETTLKKHVGKIESRYVNNDEHAQIINDIIYEKRSKIPWIVELDCLTDSCIWEIGDVISIKTLEAQKYIVDYEQKKWVIIGKGLDLMNQDAPVTIKAFYLE